MGRARRLLDKSDRGLYGSRLPGVLPTALTITLLFLLHPRGSEIASASGTCAVAIAARSGYQSHFQSQSGDRTAEFIAYLSELLERGTISDTELSRFLESLKNRTPHNPISEQDTLTDGSKLIHRQYLESLLQAQELDSKKLRLWASSLLKEKKKIRSKRKKIEIEILVPYKQMTFHPVTVDRKIEVMSTHVTQAHWVKIMGDNPSHFKGGDGSVFLKIGSKSIQLQPDFPVGLITWWAAVEFANRLSIKHGLKPAYDLSKFEWDPSSRAEIGFIFPKPGAENVRAAIESIPSDTEIVNSEGFRLPTYKEITFLIEFARDTIRNSPDPKATLDQYAWHRSNSQMRQQPVAELKPFVIDGSLFFDLLGNVSSICHSARVEFWPKTQFDPTQRMAVGGYRMDGYNEIINGLWWQIHLASSNGRDVDGGFRLVRTLHE